MGDAHPFYSVANLATLQRGVAAHLAAATGAPVDWGDDGALADAMVAVAQHPDWGGYLHGNTTARDLELLNAEVIRRVAEPLLEPETAGQYWHHNALYAPTRDGRRKEKTGLVHVMDHTHARAWHRRQLAQAKAAQAQYTALSDRFAGTVPRPSHDSTLRDL